MSLHEPINNKLQKDIEQTIFQYEEEKRQEIQLDQKIKELETEFERLKSKKIEKEKKELVAECISLQKRLEVSQVHFNSAQNENIVIRTKIDQLRIVIASCKNKVKSLENDINRSKTLKTAKHLERDREKSQENNKLTEIRMTMSKSAKEKLRYHQKLEAISSTIKQEKHFNFQSIKKINENLESMLNKKLKVLDNTKIIKQLCDRLQQDISKLNYKLVKTKQHNTKLFNCFETIRNQSNIRTVDEFVKNYLNFYDEFTNLSKYLLETLAEVESLEFANKKIENMFEESNQIIFNSNNKAARIYSELNQNMRKTYKSMHNCIKHQSILKDQIEKVRYWLIKSLNIGENLAYTLTTSKYLKFSIQNKINVFDDTYNIQEYLALLEELIHSIKIFNLYSSNNSFLVHTITFSPERRRLTPDINVICK